MGKDYEIISLTNDSDYKCLIILCHSDSPYAYLDNIARKMKSLKDNQKVLVDEIAHVGNTEKRFIEFVMIDGKLTNEKIVSVPKNSAYRALSCGFLKNRGIIEGTAVTSIQSRMINKGIVI